MDPIKRMLAKIQSQTGVWVDRAVTTLLVGGTGIIMVVLFAAQFPTGNQYQLEAGTVSPSTIVAPRQITYESQILTEEARERAAQAVEPQYDPPESRVRRQQVERTEEILEFVSIVRNDPYATRDIQVDYLAAIPDLSLTQEQIGQIMELSPEEWDNVVTEVPRVLATAMREEIHNTESALKSARRSVPALIEGDFSEPANNLVTELVRDLIRPNSFYNEERTEELRNVERNKVPIQTVSLERDEVILRAGDVVTPQDVEALEQVGLLQSEWNWWLALRALLWSVALIGVVGAALYRLRPETLASNQQLALLALATILWLLLARLMIIPHEWLPYLYPMATLGMLIGVLIDLRVAIVITLAFTLSLLYFSAADAMVVVYASVGSLVGALTLGRAERLTAFLWAGLAVMLSNLLVFAAFRAPFMEFTTSKQMQMLLVLALSGGLSASIALIGYFVLGNIFGITTSLQLTELSRPTHPLLRQLLLKSPGTYHHTIVVSNLSERAAAAIGADAFLTRVGAYYHDIGKTVRPYFFIENSADGAESPHDKLDPLTSAQIIISHINDGVDLAQKYKLPARIRDFIREHHGTSLVQYFYAQAQRQAKPGEVVDENDFRYAGPRPRTKETAILMLADTCESAVRAIRPATRADLADVVNNLIDSRVADGDLDECDLTFRELQTIKDVFLQVLQGVHHPRIAYPQRMKLTPQPADAPAAAANSKAPEKAAPRVAATQPAERRDDAPAHVPGGYEQFA
jgi:hypothetical protein